MKLGFGKRRVEKAPSRPDAPVAGPPAAPRAAGASASSQLAPALGGVSIEVIGQHLNAGARGFALCGVNVGAGVSFLTAHLGVALADAGVSTLIVDANLRDPAMQDYFPPGGPVVGLRDLLEDEGADIASALVSHTHPNLSILYAGAPLADPERLLDGRGFRQLAEWCLRESMCVLFDTPPANRSSDARRIASAVGYAVVVARQGVTFTDDVIFLSRSLREDGVLVVGALLNGA